MLQKSENRLAELDRLFKRIYEDMVGGKLSEARFQMLADDYEQEQVELREKIDILEDEIQQQEDQAENVDKFIRQAKKYLHLEKLTPAVLNNLVKAVYVHARTIPVDTGCRMWKSATTTSAFFLPLYSMIYRTKKRHDRNHAVSRKQL